MRPLCLHYFDIYVYNSKFNRIGLIYKNHALAFISSLDGLVLSYKWRGRTTDERTDKSYKWGVLRLDHALFAQARTMSEKNDGVKISASPTADDKTIYFLTIGKGNAYTYSCIK